MSISACYHLKKQLALAISIARMFLCSENAVITLVLQNMDYSKQTHLPQH